jgi:hypothetical protein
MKSKATTVGTDRHFTNAEDRALKRFIQPYHMAMVDRAVMQEIPDVTNRLAAAGTPTLFELRAAGTNTPQLQ